MTLKVPKPRLFQMPVFRQMKHSACAQRPRGNMAKQFMKYVFIGLKKVKKAALTDAKLEETNVTFSTIKFEDDERTPVYEIEFYRNRQEFECGIDAYTGEILKMERD